MVKITGKSGIIDVVKKHPETAEVFAKYGMHCIGCMAAQFENLEQGCQMHGIDTDKMVADLNKAVEKEKSKK